MKYLKRINELVKSNTYIDRTSTVYGEGGNLKLSRFVAYTSEYTQGWEIVGMQEVDKEGHELSDKYKKFKDFKFDNSIDEHSEKLMKSAISAALGEISNASWIEGFKFESNKAYAVILLGKVGLVFGDKIFTPIFRYPSKREGTTFWISANFDKGEQYARTITVTNPDISNNELLRNAIDLQNQSYYQQFLERNAQKSKEGRALERAPKTVNERAFANSFDVIRDTGEKQFFIIYIKDSKYNPIEYARKAAGANIDLSAVRVGNMETGDDKKRGYTKQKSFNLTETDPRIKVFYYYNKQTEKWESYLLDRVIKTKPDVHYKELEVFKGRNKVRLRIFAGDKLRIAKLDEKDPQNTKIHLYDVEVGRIDAKDNKKLELRQTNQVETTKEKPVKEPKVGKEKPAKEPKVTKEPPAEGEEVTKRPVGRPKKQI